MNRMQRQIARAPDRTDYEAAYRAALETVLAEAEKGAKNAGQIVAKSALKSVGLDRGEYIPGDRWLSVNMACEDARVDAAAVVKAAGRLMLEELYPDARP